ncbi:MAG: CocE/NonD family hydrolase [Deltaproteobacteria bacterium]|nr:CocE/NonD family hydrolase [Deltaproteobacteria bacterium]
MKSLAMRTFRCCFGLLIFSLLAAGCGDDGEGGTVPTVAATFTVSPGVEQVTVTNAPPKATLVLYSPQGRKMLGLITDTFGQAVFAYVPDEYEVVETGNSVKVNTTRGRTLKGGSGYFIRNESIAPIEQSAPFHVLSRDDVPPDSFYDAQHLDKGFTYIEMRDGVKLSATVRFPGGAKAPPYPTVIEYSGYGPSNPDSPEPGTMIAGLLGFATVGVNMRGTGCSGGSFDVFNPAQQADGYDIIEAVARQPWVMHNQVGMIGLSYSGISQLYVASTRPPHLAAITPLSVIEDPWREQWPGGVYNSGFTRQWIAERDRESAPGGSGWVQKRIDGGDMTCAENQVLRTQNIDFEHFGRLLEFYPPDEDDRRLDLLVRKINVPVFLTGGWQDEQTGSLFANLLDEFREAPTKKFLVFNGRHPDGYSPTAITRWFEFLEFYVAKRIPRIDALTRTLAPAAFEGFFHVKGLGFEPDRFPNYTDYGQALAAYEAEQSVRVLFEVGGSSASVPGAPVARFEADFPSWPPAAQARRWYLGADNTLTDNTPSAALVDKYQHDPAAGPITYSTTGAYDFIYPMIQFDWPPLADGYGLSYLTEPFAEDTVVAGNGGYADLWFASEAADANIEVTLTQVQPDGTEVIVQSGVLRAGHRKIDTTMSDEFHIDYTFSEADFRPLTPGQFIEVKVPIRPFSQPFRAGSRLRLIIDTPGRDSPLWAYENPDYGRDIFHMVAHAPDKPSSIVLPVVDGIQVPAGYPPCPSLRGQICRPYVPLVNHAAGQ